jgi:hypothetical protein
MHLQDYYEQSLSGMIKELGKTFAKSDDELPVVIGRLNDWDCPNCR